MKTQFEELKDAVQHGESLRLELEQSRRELEACQQRLAQIDELFVVHKKSEALLHGEKKLTEMIARGDALEAILEGSCRLVEQATSSLLIDLIPKYFDPIGDAQAGACSPPD